MFTRIRCVAETSNVCVEPRPTARKRADKRRLERAVMRVFAKCEGCGVHEIQQGRQYALARHGRTPNTENVVPVPCEHQHALWGNALDVWRPSGLLRRFHRQIVRRGRVAAGRIEVLQSRIRRGRRSEIRPARSSFQAGLDGRFDVLPWHDIVRTRLVLCEPAIKLSLLSLR